MQILRGVFVDSFKVKKPKCIYFLTHWHADHYWGLTTKWDYGPIFCSQTTKKILLTKYPKLNEITHGLVLGQTYQLESPEGIQFKVAMFDSNHIAGSVIILFNFANSYTLHTGDMRFNSSCLHKNKQLFAKDEKTGEFKCRYEIDTLFLDNTYCDPIFMFPNRSDALKMIKDIIDLHQPGSRMVYLVTDSIGKEQAFVGLSLYYKVPVTLWGQRMNYVKQMFDQPLLSKIFCSKNDSKKRGSWIQVIKRRYVQKTLEQDGRAIAIKLTGWANIQDSYPLSQREYIVPYSLHSNYQQLELFMSVIKPKNLHPVVRLNHNKSNKFRQNIHSYNSYFGSLAHMKQRGFQFFSSHYLSADFKSNTKEKQQMENRQSINLKKFIDVQHCMQKQEKQVIDVDTFSSSSPLATQLNKLKNSRRSLSLQDEIEQEISEEED